MSPGGPLPVREATVADLETVASWIGSAWECVLWAGSNVPYPLELDRLPEQIDMASAINLGLDDLYGLTGFGQVLPREPHRAHLARIIVRPDARGRGTGRALCLALLERAAAAGCTLATLNVYSANTAALSLYAGLGFRRVERPPGEESSPEIQYLERPVGDVKDGVSLRPVVAIDLTTIDRWADAVADHHLSRTRPHTEGADCHHPDSGLFWYVIAEDGRDIGTVWIELLPERSEAVLGVFLGDPADFGRGIGTAAVELAVAAFRRAHPGVPIVLRVRQSNERAIACYRHAGFAVAEEGLKSLPSGEDVAYYRMVLSGAPARTQA